MMMPANFSAVAENEMTYVVGGGLVDILAPVMTTENWQNVVTNLITMTGNTVLNEYGAKVYDDVFGGSYVPFGTTKKVFGSIGNAYTTGKNALNGDWGFGLGVLNAGLKVVQGLAAVYTLGTARIGLDVKKFN